MALHQDPRTGIYYFRKVIPEKLRPVFGKREFKVSLETRSLAEARQKMAEPAMRYAQLAEEAAIFATGGWSEAGRHLVEAWLADKERPDQWLRECLARITAFHRAMNSTDRGTLVPPAYAFEAVEKAPDDDELLRVRASHTRARMNWPMRLGVLKTIPTEAFGWIVEQVAIHSGKEIRSDGPLFGEVASAFRHRLLVTALEETTPRPRSGSPLPSLIVIEGGRSQDEAIGTATRRDPGFQVGLTISEAFDAWKSYTKGRPRKPQLVQEWDLAIRRFVSMYGDIDMGEIRPQMVRDFREKLLEIPGRTKKSIKALPLEEQAAIAAKEGLDTLSPATVNKSLSALRSVTEHVVDKMSKVPLEFNAAKQAKFVELDDSEEKRLPFDEGDMEAIFRNLAITDRTGISEETLFWIVLLAPFTGCRLEELGTLRPLNVRSEQGIWFIAIERDRAQVRAEQGQEEKGRKNQNAERDIPLHPILHRAGFLEYFQRRRDEGAEWLFPDLKPNKYGKRTYRVSRLFAQYLEGLGITDDEKVFHSFRHSIRRILRGRAPEEMVDLICGHSDGKVGRRYGRGADMRPLQVVINLIDYNGPDWGSVVAKGRHFVGLPPEKPVSGGPTQLGLSL
ncbi:DUF6538 domain-containing protein [Novosphingobium sp. M1R2S20]|uniref:DUF6538 domain-containing protein n=1 Tax=Novosphingobium rhizovicinum TaxID=3228928 RepID=A0ABV3R7M0_9SPHN